MYDLIIIGGGPGGTAGAVYAARKQLKTLVITAEWGGQSNVSEGIKNWIGTVNISGADLAKSFREHIRSHEGDYLEVSEGKVTTLTKNADGGFNVKTDTDKEFTGKAILITSGSGRRKITVPGADTFENKGITYCASCDGPLFGGMDVAVIGGGNAAFETVAQLTAYCKHVTLIHRSETFRADEVTVGKIKKDPKVTIITNAELISVEGTQFVSGLKYKIAGGEEQLLPVAGIFVEIGQIPNNDFAKDIVKMNEAGKIIIDPWTQKTSEAGIWAAGDVTNILYHQNNIAAGDAVKALEDIYMWVHKNS